MPIEQLKDRFGADILAADAPRGEQTVVVSRDRARDVLRALRQEAAFDLDFLVDLTAVDWPDRKPRFDVIYQLGSFSKSDRLRVKVGVEGPEPWAASVADLWKAADWLERECYDMFGIVFRGHPDLRRILLYDAFEGHPLRKDYPATRRQPLVPETDPVLRPIRSSR